MFNERPAEALPTQCWVDSHARQLKPFARFFEERTYACDLIALNEAIDKAAVINDRLLMMRYVGGFILTALVLRIGAEIYASQYKRLIHFSSGFWLLAAIIWTGLTLPKIMDGWYKLSVE